MTNSKQYKKDLTKITSFRLSPNLLNEGIQCADSLGLSFSDFLRQSLVKNLGQITKACDSCHSNNTGKLI
jgi:hypothetical protein